MTDWLRLDRVKDGVALIPRLFGAARADRPRTDLGTLGSAFGTDLGACRLEGLGVEPAELGKAAGFWGGLTGSNAGLWGSPLSGRGVEGVDCEAHLVPKPWVRCVGVADIGVCGVEGVPRRLTGVLTAWRIICSGIAGLGG